MNNNNDSSVVKLVGITYLLDQKSANRLIRFAVLLAICYHQL